MKFIPRPPFVSSLASALFFFVILAGSGAPASAQLRGAQQQQEVYVSDEEAERFRADFVEYLNSADALVSGFGLKKSSDLFAQARQKVEALTPDQLRLLRRQLGDSAALVASTEKIKGTTERLRGVTTELSLTRRADATLAPLSSSPGFPSAPFSALCGSEPPMSTEDYFALQTALLTAKGVVSAASRGCDETIVILGAGGNASLACLPFDIAVSAAEIALEEIAFCFDDIDGALIQGSYDRLGHIHTDIESSVANDDNNKAAVVANSDANKNTIVANDNTNKTAIINNDNSNKTAILADLEASKTAVLGQIGDTGAAIMANDNTNRNTIVANDNANKTAIIANDNANTTTILNAITAAKIELRDLILRTQIEAALADNDASSPVALYQTPTAQGGYLDLVRTIVVQTIANTQAAGGGIGNAQSFLQQADAQKAAGQFKSAYANYRKAYQAATK